MSKAAWTEQPDSIFRIYIDAATVEKISTHEVKTAAVLTRSRRGVSDASA